MRAKPLRDQIIIGRLQFWAPRLSHRFLYRPLHAVHGMRANARLAQIFGPLEHLDRRFMAWGCG
jgi:hypothetical protein